MRAMFLRFPEGKAKAVTFSYDDGCPQDMRLSDIFTTYQMKGTFNLNSDALRRGNALSREEVESHFFAHGHEVAIHGYWHRPEGILRPIEGIRDVLDCRLELEQKYGRVIRGMAYPDTGITVFDNTASYEKVRNYLQELDIAYSRTLGADNNSFCLPSDWYAWMPTAHHTNPSLMEYIDEFLSLDLSAKRYYPRRSPRLFYLWGHSYEFDNNHNWDLIETVCKRFAENRDSLWFATNMEIHDYVEAYNALIHSADGSILYNPTLFDIWFDADGTVYCIKSGETMRL